VKVVPPIVGPVRVSGVPSLDSSTTSNESSESSIAEFNSTVQVTVTEGVSFTGLGGVLMTDTEAMEGTEGGI
jgi:hypothetical protein